MGEAMFTTGLPSAGYLPTGAYKNFPFVYKQHEAQAGEPTQEDLILAINKLFGTAPAMARRQSAGFPFLAEPVAGLVPVMPSPEANAKAFELFQQAQIPVELDQATQARMMTEHLQKLGILP